MPRRMTCLRGVERRDSLRFGLVGVMPEVATESVLLLLLLRLTGSKYPRLFQDDTERELLPHLASMWTVLCLSLTGLLCLVRLTFVRCDDHERAQLASIVIVYCEAIDILSLRRHYLIGRQWNVPSQQSRRQDGTGPKPRSIIHKKNGIPKQ